MLDAFIIEELRRREQRSQEHRRPQLEIHDEEPYEEGEGEDEEPDEDQDRGVVIIDYGV